MAERALSAAAGEGAAEEEGGEGAADPAVPRLMTVHQSKGLEAEAVHLLGCHDGCIPLMGRCGEEVDEDEEVRVAYVAMTRASRAVCLSWSRRGSHEPDIPWSQPSRQRCSRFFCDDGGCFRHVRIEAEAGEG